MTSKRCEGCGQSYERRKREGRRDYINRRFCSQSCRAQNIKNYRAMHKANDEKRAKGLGPKPCAYCGQLFHRKAWQRPNKFKDQKYCSQACALHSPARLVSLEKANAARAKLDVKRHQLMERRPEPIQWDPVVPDADPLPIKAVPRPEIETLIHHQMTRGGRC